MSPPSSPSTFTSPLMRADIGTSLLRTAGSAQYLVTSLLLRGSVNVRGGASVDTGGMALISNLRADSATLRQGASNLGDASALAGAAATGMQSLAASLTSMKNKLTEWENTSGRSGQGKAMIEAMGSLAEQVRTTIKGTSKNGLHLFDNTTWSGDERLKSKDNFQTASLDVQAGSMKTPLTLRGQNSVMSAISGGQLDLSGMSAAEVESLTADELAAKTAALDTLIADANLQADLYAKKQNGFTNMATSLNSQADILDSAVTMHADRNISPPSLESLGLALLTQSSGFIVRTRG